MKAILSGVWSWRDLSYLDIRKKESMEKKERKEGKKDVTRGTWWRTMFGDVSGGVCIFFREKSTQKVNVKFEREFTHPCQLTYILYPSSILSTCNQYTIFFIDKLRKEVRKNERERVYNYTVTQCASSSIIIINIITFISSSEREWIWECRPPSHRHTERER